jgi:hypothetical protein
MALRFAKLSIVACACLVAGVVIGLLLAPASAQQVMSGIDGQVAVRSDYAVYLISNGQRRWIATVLITDEEINAYPEAEPIFSGVTPLPPQPGQAAPPPVPAASPPPSPPPAVPAAPAPAAAPASAPAPVAPAPAAPGAVPGAPGAVPPAPGAVAPAPGAVAPAPGAVPPPAPAAAAPAPVAPAPAAPAPAAPAPAAAAPPPPVPAAPAAAPPPPVTAPPPATNPAPAGAPETDPLLPIRVAIAGRAVFEQGNQIAVEIEAKTGASCELTVRWPNATEEAQPSQIADARGRCAYTIRVPSVPNGLGFMKGSVRDGGRVSNQTVEFQIVDTVE